MENGGSNSEKGEFLTITNKLRFRAMRDTMSKMSDDLTQIRRNTIHPAVIEDALDRLRYQMFIISAELHELQELVEHFDELL